MPPPSPSVGGSARSSGRSPRATTSAPRSASGTRSRTFHPTWCTTWWRWSGSLVTNVVRHAEASRLTVAVTVADTVSVVVTDDGRGLPSITVRSGLTNLDDRAERRGGRMTTSTGESGTEVSWTVPLPTSR